MDSTFEESSLSVEAELVFIWLDSLILSLIQFTNGTKFSGVSLNSAKLIITMVLKSARHLVDFGCQHLQMQNDFDMYLGPRKFKIKFITGFVFKATSYNLFLLVLLSYLTLSNFSETI